MEKTMKILKWAGITLATLILMLVLINVADEDLDPGIAEFSDFSKDQVPDEQNAYYSYYALHAPIGSDIHASGKKIVKTMNLAIKNPSLSSSEKFKNGPEEIIAGKWLGYSFGYKKACDPDLGSCLGAYRKHKKYFKDKITKNRVLLSRYLGLDNYPHFRETLVLDFSSQLPGVPDDAHALNLAEIGLIFNDGKVTLALKRLRKDILFWQKVLNESHTLMSKMVSVYFITLDLGLMTEILSSHHLDKSQSLILSETLSTLNSERSDISDAFRTEFVYSVSTLKLIKKDVNEYYSSSFMKPPWYHVIPSYFLKINATINDDFQSKKNMVAMAHLDVPGFFKKMENLKSTVYKQKNHDYGLDVIYNPVGKIRAGTGDPVSMGLYIARVHNLEVRSRLLAVAFGLSGKVGKQDMPAYLKTLPKTLLNPYNGAAPSWDAEKEELFFMVMSKKYLESKESLGKKITVSLVPKPVTWELPKKKKKKRNRRHR